MNRFRICEHSCVSYSRSEFIVMLIFIVIANRDVCKRNMTKIRIKIEVRFHFEYIGSVCVLTSLSV